MFVAGVCSRVADVLLDDASPNEAARFKPKNEPDGRMSDATASNATAALLLLSG